MHDDIRTTASKDTYSVSEVEHKEGQYGPWMVVRRKKKGHKGPRLGQIKEGSGTSTWNYSFHNNPKNTDGINISVGGPSQSQNAPCGGFLHKAGVQARNGGLGQDQGFSEKFLSCLPKEASLTGELRHLDCFNAHEPNSGPSTLLDKTFPHSL